MSSTQNAMASGLDPVGAGDPYVNFTSDQAVQHLLLSLARRFKGVDPDVDRRIDAAASAIAGQPNIKSIPARVPGEPNVPLYMEGEPGVGKTSLIRSAIKEFCRITELNFVENPEDNYIPGPKDFYYFTVNLSGKNNPMDIGGLPSKGELATRQGLGDRHKAIDVGDWLLQEAESRIRMGSGMLGLPLAEPRTVLDGGLRRLEMTIKGDAAQVDLTLNTVVKQLSEEAKRRGVGVNLLRDGEMALEGRLYLQIEKGAAGARLSAIAPQRAEAEAEYVSEMLPNRRFALANKFRFALVNFDDVANASESVRNVLLEVAQSNRYSGVMDIGNAEVTFTGNMGSEDGTNTQSEQSDAEVSRVYKVRVRDTPKHWAARTAAKYGALDCFMSAFVHKYGHEPGIFRPLAGDMRGDRGIPKPNSRSLENAVAAALPYFQMAKESGVSPMLFADRIDQAFKATAGNVVATRCMGFIRAMLSDAVPLADQLMSTGDLDRDRFNKAIGANLQSHEKDFAFRFGAALGDAFVHRIAHSTEAAKAIADGNNKAHGKIIAEATDRMCTGLAQLDPGNVNYTLSYIVNKLSSTPSLALRSDNAVSLSQNAMTAMATGLGTSISRDIWDDPEQATNSFAAILSHNNRLKRATPAP
ncbi:MAG: hypothetical protein O9327_03185 [Polaromonas sp.]|nr:hypothetical protein [Polaromonas sp.]